MTAGLSPVNFVANKAPNAVRDWLLELLGVNDTYLLDRLDLKVQTAIDQSVQHSVTHFFEKVTDPQNDLAAGLIGDQLLGTGNPGRVVYSFTLYEHDDGSTFCARTPRDFAALRSEMLERDIYSTGFLPDSSAKIPVLASDRCLRGIECHPDFGLSPL